MPYGEREKYVMFILYLNPEFVSTEEEKMYLPSYSRASIH